MKKSANIAPNLHLKRARERQGWSQDHVAREVGTDSFTVSRWERGVVTPSPYFRQKLSALFGMSAAELGLVPQETDERAGQGPVQQALAPVVHPAIPSPQAVGYALVGRDHLLRQLQQRLLTGGRVALSAINGLPGVGKTALATALAHNEEVRAYFSDGILWAGAGSEPDGLGLPRRWGPLLGSPPPELAQRSRPDAWAVSIHAAIGQRRMLLVIDDAWDIAHALALQVGGPNCAYLVTTRFPEIARRFAAEGAAVVRELEDTEGRMLLMRLAPEVVQAEPEEAHALVAAVGGLPLALTLLGNYLRVQAHSGQPRRLRVVLERLRSVDGRLHLAEPQALVGGHPSLSAGTPLSLQVVIGISDQQVSEEAQAALRALAIFPPKPNTFSEEAAAAVSAMPVEALDELTDAGLLESSGPERYTLHQTIADYARAHLADTIVFGRLVTYFVAYAEAHTTDNAALDRESYNILAALEAAFEHGMRPDLVRGVHAFASFLETRGLYTVAETHLQRAREAALSLNDAASQAMAWLHLGSLMERRGDYGLAQDYWQNGLVLARQSRHNGLIAETLKELGNLARQQGQPEQAYQFFEEALAVSRRTGNRRDEGGILRNLGILARERGQPELARQLYEEALAASRQVGDQREIARTLNNLGVLARQQGQPEQARQMLEEALSTFRQLEDRREGALALRELGTLARVQGQPQQARQMLEEALSAFLQLEDQREGALTQRESGILAREQGQPEQARQQLEEALSTFRQLEDRRESARTLKELGTLAREQGQLEQAHQLLEEALGALREVGDRREFARSLLQLGIVVWKQGHLEEAVGLLLRAGVGLTLVDAPDARVVEEVIGQVRTQMGENALHATVRRVAKEVPEPAYGLAQMEWTTAIRKLTTQALVN